MQIVIEQWYVGMRCQEVFQCWYDLFGRMMDFVRETFYLLSNLHRELLDGAIFDERFLRDLIR